MESKYANFGQENRQNRAPEYAIVLHKPLVKIQTCLTAAYPAGLTLPTTTMSSAINISSRADNPSMLPSTTNQLSQNQSTPQSEYAGSQAISQDLLERQRKVEEANKELLQDVRERESLDIHSWADIFLGISPKDYQDRQWLPDTEAAYKEYLLAASREGHEKLLYPILVKLLNSLRPSDQKDDRKSFYIQDPYHVHGSTLQHIPDICALYEAICKDPLKLHEKLKTEWKVFWALVLFFLEVKHKKGRTLEVKYSK